MLTRSWITSARLDGNRAKQRMRVLLMIQVNDWKWHFFRIGPVSRIEHHRAAPMTAFE